MTDVLVVQELEPLVYILEHPKIGLDVERRHVIMKVVRVLKDSEFNICTAWKKIATVIDESDTMKLTNHTAPVFDAGFLIA